MEVNLEKNLAVSGVAEADDDEGWEENVLQAREVRDRQVAQLLKQVWGCRRDQMSIRFICGVAT